MSESQTNGQNTIWDLAPAPEGTAHVQLKPSYDLFINGKFQPSAKGTRFKSINPATEKPIAELTEATAADVDKAVKAARSAYEKHWSKTSPRDRGKYIYRIATTTIGAKPTYLSTSAFI